MQDLYNLIWHAKTYFFYKHLDCIRSNKLVIQGNFRYRYIKDGTYLIHLCFLGYVFILTHVFVLSKCNYKPSVWRWCLYQDEKVARDSGGCATAGQEHEQFAFLAGPHRDWALSAYCLWHLRLSRDSEKTRPAAGDVYCLDNDLFLHYFTFLQQRW